MGSVTVESLIWYAGAFLLALGVLVVVHELGHYLAARLCNVKVLRFSIGFGRVLAARKFGRDRTEWAVASIPLGGYVKMLDEREGEVAAHERERAFNRQSVGRRALIVVAGPVANLLLAVVLYWGLFMTGVIELKPRLATPPAGTAAAMAGVTTGSTVRAVNGQAIASWQDLRWEVLRQALDREPLHLDVQGPPPESVASRVVLQTSQFDLQELEKDPLRPFGLLLFRPPIPAIIGRVTPGSAAESAGMQIGDRIVAIDAETIADWSRVATIARASIDKPLNFVVDRAGIRHTMVVVPRSVEDGGLRVGRIGLAPQENSDEISNMTVTVSYGPIEAFGRACVQTWDTSVLSLRMMGRMLTGELSWKNLSGPVTIADYAGQSARLGLSYYLRFLALISISLGVLNLLPVPVLDGGHLMYYLAEFIKGGPVSERALEIGQQIGLALLALLMAFAFYNDFNRLVG